jgi:hypothetical protein
MITPCIIGVGIPDRRTGHLRKWLKGRLQYVHRTAWEEANGPIPDGMKVLHKCDNPPCRNIDHLFLGTLGDNNRDRAAKGRSATGERHSRAKLTAAAVLEIRAMLEMRIPMKTIGSRFGVHWTTIQSIRHRETWKNV